MARRQSRRGRKGYRERTINRREVRQRFLIVCEGGKTEPNYFRQFRVPGLVIDVEGFGLDPRQLVDEAVTQSRKDEYDQVWCVFDRDDWPVDNFNGALSSARAREIRVAWSNEAFELWYLLHFHYHDTAIPRSEYMTRLGSLLGRAYRKNRSDMYTELFDKMDVALKNAERLFDQYHPSNPAQDNPSTTVHLLVMELRRFAH